MKLPFSRNIFLFEILALIAIASLVYLVHVFQFSYYRDDWYYMYDGLVGGSRFFVEYFRHLRPARGPLYELLFNWFGISPLPYHLLLFLSRLAGALGSLWFFRLLWPRQRTATFFMTLLFLIYPGFLWWIQGFEYQPMVLSVGFQVFSITFTLKSLELHIQGGHRVLWILASFLTGWLCIFYVDYAIGMELFRWLCIFLYLQHNKRGTWRENLMQAGKWIAIYILIPILFLIWHTFIFDNERKAADLGLQLNIAISAPTLILWWIVRFLKSTLDIVLSAWIVPLNHYFSFLRLREIVVALIVISVVILILSFIVRRQRQVTEETPSLQNWSLEAIALGLIGVAGGIVPIIIANRTVALDRFSHYALPASLAAIPLIVGLVYLVENLRIRLSILFVLVGLATLTHFSLASQAKNEEQLIANFWHQVAWRAPSIRPDTLLVVNYAGLNYGDEKDIISGPANLIYYPEPQNKVDITTPISAVYMDTELMKNLLTGAQYTKGLTSNGYNFRNLLVMTLPTETACVHVIDPSWNELSIHDPALIILTAAKSKIENIVINDTQSVPQEIAFGSEPKHAWCYFYQKAQLARQQGDWQTVSKLAKEVKDRSLQPNDGIEWMPFLQSAAVQNDLKEMKHIASLINSETLYKQQACQNLTSMPELMTEIRQQAEELFCGSK